MKPGNLQICEVLNPAVSAFKRMSESKKLRDKGEEHYSPIILGEFFIFFTSATQSLT